MQQSVKRQISKPCTVVQACPFEQSLCAMVSNGNEIDGCPLCHPYAMPRPKKGLAKPHYPLPAIPLEIDWTDANEGLLFLCRPNTDEEPICFMSDQYREMFLHFLY